MTGIFFLRDYVFLEHTILCDFIMLSDGLCVTEQKEWPYHKSVLNFYFILEGRKSRKDFAAIGQLRENM